MNGLSLQGASKDLQMLKSAIADVEKMQEELAEFFCEDPASFKIDECFKSIWGFCAKFKKVLHSPLLLPSG
jgi:hypothetical protein